MLSAASEIKPDYRHGYYEQYRAHVAQYKEWRAAGEIRRVELPGLRRLRRICDLTDRQIEEIARRHAEYDMCHWMNEDQEPAVEARNKRRRGEAF